MEPGSRSELDELIIREIKNQLLRSLKKLVRKCTCLLITQKLMVKKTPSERVSNQKHTML